MKRPSFSLLLLITVLLMMAPSLAQESARSRLTEFLKVHDKAKTYSEIQPYFTEKGWKAAYGYVEGLDAEAQAEVLADTAASLKGWTITDEKVQGDGVIFTLSPGSGTEDPQTVKMVLDQGIWKLDE